MEICDLLKQKTAIIIGAGIHGCRIAIELSKIGFKVTILDRNKEILMGASHATHNRIHLGYHYPRSVETIAECKLGYKIINDMYADCLSFPDFYYLISENDSYLSKDEYEESLLQNDLEISRKWPEEDFINKKHIAESYITSDCCFDKNKIADKIKEEFNELNILFKNEYDIARVVLNKNDNISIIDSNENVLNLDADIIVNCTYAFTNNIQKIFGVNEKLKMYRFIDTEVVVVKSDLDIPGLTIMDGPFITILPYAGKKGHYLVYDVVDSSRNIFQGQINRFKTYEESNWLIIREKCKKFFPFYDKLEYVGSLYSSRPVPIEDSSDNRETNIIKHDYPIDFYSICEGKFCTAPMFGIQFAEMVKNKIIEQHHG